MLFAIKKESKPLCISHTAAFLAYQYFKMGKECV